MPLAAVEALRSKVARTVEPVPQLPDPPVQVEHSPGFAGPPPAAEPERVAVAVQLDSQAGQFGAALVALATQQAAAIAPEARAQAIAAQVEAAHFRAQPAQVEMHAAQLRAVVERHQRPTVPLGELRHLLVR